MWNHDIVLLGEKEVSGYDLDDNPLYTRQETDALCIERSVTRDEFYQASMAGFHPKFTVLMNPIEYDNQKECRYRGEVLSIARAYGPVQYKGLSLVELQLVERIGGHD